MIQSKQYTVKNDEGFFTLNNVCETQNIKKFYLTYKFLITEWDSSLFTPYEFLKDIIRKINIDNHYNRFNY